MRFVFLVASCLCVLTGAANAANGRISSEVSLEPAIATYSVSLFAPTEAYATAEGVFTDKATRACDGWHVEQRLMVKLVPVSKDVRPVVADFLRSGSNAYESQDGLTYSFEDKSTMRGEVISSHKGVATLTAVGQAGTAIYQDPANQQVALPAGTIFPTSFSEQLVHAAGNTDLKYGASVFDGSMGIENGALRMEAIIGDPRGSVFRLSQPGRSASREREYNTLLAWPVKVSISSLTATDGKPLTENLLSLLPNGRAETMIMDFGQFKLRFDLAKYEPISQPACN